VLSNQLLTLGGQGEEEGEGLPLLETLPALLSSTLCYSSFSINSPVLHTHTYTHAHARTRAHTRTHTRTHTHTHTKAGQKDMSYVWQILLVYRQKQLWHKTLQDLQRSTLYIVFITTGASGSRLLILPTREAEIKRMEVRDPISKIFNTKKG
jgi:hypothetical protein